MQNPVSGQPIWPPRQDHNLKMTRLVRSKVDFEFIPVELLAIVAQCLSGRDVPMKGIMEVCDSNGTKGLLGNFLKTSKTFKQAADLFFQKGAGWKPNMGFMTPRFRITLGIEEPPMPIQFVVVDYGLRLKERLRMNAPHLIIHVQHLQAAGQMRGNETVGELLKVWDRETGFGIESLGHTTLSVSSAQGIQSLPTGVSAECFDYIAGDMFDPDSLPALTQDNVGFFTMEDPLPFVDLTAETIDVSCD